MLWLNLYVRVFTFSSEPYINNKKTTTRRHYVNTSVQYTLTWYCNKAILWWKMKKKMRFSSFFCSKPTPCSSNDYPQSMFWAEKRKIVYTPVLLDLCKSWVLEVYFGKSLFGFDGNRLWDLFVSAPLHWLSFTFRYALANIYYILPMCQNIKTILHMHFISQESIHPVSRSM